MNIRNTIEKPVRPIKAIQFGEGNFLRAFVDWIVDNLNEKADFNGDVMIVQPLRNGMGDMLNDQNGIYTTVLRGVKDGKTVEQFRKITSVRGCVNPYTDHDAFLRLAELPEIRFVFSNTTEAGIAYREGVRLEDAPQDSFPGKVTAFLYHRWKHYQGDPAKGLIFIPCELIDKNGDNLRRIVLRHAEEWKLEDGFVKWIEESCDFCNSLVDRIVPGYPRTEVGALTERLGYEDNLLDAAEYFLLWVIEHHRESHIDELPTDRAGLNVIWTDDMSFYRTRKVRILNGAHTMTVLAAFQTGLDTVEECMHDPLVSDFMKKGIFEEIIPSMDGDRKELESYASDVLERFQNPHIIHKLLSISLNSVSKFKTRDLPSLISYSEKTGKLPKRLALSLAALISFYEGRISGDGTYLTGKRGDEEYRIQDTPDVLSFMSGLWEREYASIEEKAERVAEEVISNTEWWDMDLREIGGLSDFVKKALLTIWTKGMTAAVRELI